MRYLGLASSVLLLSSYAHCLMAAPATEEEMALSALQAEVRSADVAVANRAVEASRDFLHSKSLQAAAEEMAVTIVFSRGLTAADVERFAKKHNLEISRAESKVPVGDDGTVFTMSVGARDLLLLEGPLSERLTKASGNQQFQMMQAAPRAPREQADRLLEVAHTPVLLYFKIEAIGQAKHIAALEKAKEVKAILHDHTSTKLASYRIHKQKMARAKANGVPPIKGRRLEDGPPPGVPAARIMQPQ